MSVVISEITINRFSEGKIFTNLLSENQFLEPQFITLSPKTGSTHLVNRHPNASLFFRFAGSICEGLDPSDPLLYGVNHLPGPEVEEDKGLPEP